MASEAERALWKRSIILVMEGLQNSHRIMDPDKQAELTALVYEYLEEG